MNRSRPIVTLAFLALFAATAALASWYDDYDDGLAAARKGQWQLVVQKMTAAINGHPKEGDRERTYGAIFYNYHPYYYRGVAYLNLGRYEQAISDFEKTTGPGEENLGPIDALMQRAKSKLQSNQETQPQPQPVPAPVPPPVPRPVPAPVPVPAPPSIDPALRQQAAAAINQAKARLSAAQQRKAGNTSQYAQAMTQLTEALTKNAGVKSNDDLSQVISLAQNAATIADLAPAPTPGPTPVPSTQTTRADQASALTMADTSRRVREALQLYFAGEFGDASSKFQTLSQQLPQNGWIWAFLGASQYSQYAFEADENYKTAAMQSFQKARKYGRFRDGLPQKYFSKRIRTVFQSASLQ